MVIMYMNTMFLSLCPHLPCSQCLAFDVVDFTLRNKAKLTSPVNYIEKFFPSLLKVQVISIELYAYNYACHSMSFTVVV